MVLQNCLRLDGAIAWSRAAREGLRLFKLAGMLLLVPVFFAAVNLAVVTVVDSYIVPLPIAADIFSVFDIDPKAWEYNIEKRHLGDVGARYEKWSQKQGFSSGTARFWQENLWSNWYIYVAVALYLMIAFYLLVVKVYIALIAIYKEDLIQRRQAYYEKDLYTISRDDIIF